MPNEIPASRVWVLSDLHLAPPGEQCVFQAHAALVGLLDHLAATPAGDPPNWLVLNGDVFDYLQIPGYEALSLPLAAERTGRILDGLEAEAPARNIVQALRRFVAGGHRLACMSGNHDAELNLTTVQQVLSARLGSTIALPPWNGEWRLQVAGHRVVGRHGHYGDAFNAIGSARMQRAQADGDASVALPPGSRLVLQVINPFRRAKTPDGTRRFPFIDGLPSDEAVVLAIMLLDPRLAARRLPDALGIGAAALLRKALMAGGLSSESRHLSVSHGPLQSTSPAQPKPWVDGLQDLLSEAASQQDAHSLAMLDGQLEAYFAGGGIDLLASGEVGAQPRSTDLLGFGGSAVRGLLYRALANALEGARSSFQAGMSDDLAKDSLTTWGHGHVALAGHTHAARSLTSPDGPGVYINTGTWIERVIPPTGLSAATLPDWLERLRRGDVPSWNGYPLALVDADGPRLMQWNGHSLQAWVDPTPPTI